MALRCAFRPLQLLSTPRMPAAAALMLRPAASAFAPMRAFASASSSSSSAAAAPVADDADESAFDARMQYTRQPLDRDGNAIGEPVLERTAGPLDPRHFRLPNESFIMIRVNPLHKSDKIVAGGPSSRRNTRGAPVEETAVPREKDPYLVAFRVPLHYNKMQIRNYLEEIYRISIVDVRTLIYLGKSSRSRKTGLWVKKPDWKKAYVRLLHPFPFPTLDEQRKMINTLNHEPQELPVASEQPLSDEERAQQETAQAALDAATEANRARQDHIRQQVADRLANVKAQQAERIQKSTRR